MHMQLRRMILRYYILWPIIIMSILTSMIIQLVLKTTRVFSLVPKLLGHNNSALAHNAHAFISAVCTIPSFLAAPQKQERPLPVWHPHLSCTPPSGATVTEQVQWVSLLAQQ